MCSTILVQVSRPSCIRTTSLRICISAVLVGETPKSNLHSGKLQIHATKSYHVTSILPTGHRRACRTTNAQSPRRRPASPSAQASNLKHQPSDSHRTHIWHLQLRHLDWTPFLTSKEPMTIIKLQKRSLARQSDYRMHIDAKTTIIAIQQSAITP